MDIGPVTYFHTVAHQKAVSTRLNCIRMSLWKIWPLMTFCEQQGPLSTDFDHHQMFTLSWTLSAQNMKCRNTSDSNHNAYYSNQLKVPVWQHFYEAPQICSWYNWGWYWKCLLLVIHITCKIYNKFVVFSDTSKICPRVSTQHILRILNWAYWHMPLIPSFGRQW